MDKQMHSHIEKDGFKGRGKPRGRPHKTWTKTVTEDLKALKFNANNARDRPVWKKALRTAMKNLSTEIVDRWLKMDE